MVRALAVGRALAARGAEVLLATTSQAHDLVRWSGVPAVGLPPPGTLPEAERRALLRGALRGVVEGWRPDVLVVDTFPEGPHGEATDALDAVGRCVLIRRTVRPDRAAEPAVARGLSRHQLVIVPDDPDPQPLPDHPACLRVPPVVLDAGDEPAARRALRRPDGPSVLVACGGRGDPDSAAFGEAARAACGALGWPPPVVVDGLLDGGERAVPTPAARWLGAFDVVVASAGYNTAHECAARGLPAVLYARERAFDDQRARALRFAALGLAVAVERPEEVAEALPRAVGRGPRRWPCGGADAAAAAALGAGSA